MTENDPKLHTIEGIADALDETIGEKGSHFEYGYVLIGTAYRRRARELSVTSDIPDIRDRPGVVELWATITVDKDELRRYLIADAEQHLEPGQRFEIRRKMPTNYGRTHGMCWYRNDAMDKRHTWGRVPKEPTQKEGYLLVGEYTVPSA